MKLRKIYLALPIFILALVMVGFVATQPVNSLTMDVNPSIEIVTDRLDRVVQINPLNDDAKDLLKNFDPKDKNLENTVNDLVDLMILTGHIKGGEDNFVMITVDDDSVDNNLVKKVNRAIAAMLQNKRIEATVLNQAIARSEDGKKLTGVELAAQRLNELDDDLDAEDIAEMTVRELIHYSKDHNIAIDSLFSVAAGKIDLSDNNRVMISREEAGRIALEKVNGQISKIELDDLYDDDGPEYEIEILLNGVEYKLEIDAITGKVEKLEREDDDDDDDKKEVSSTDQPKKTTDSRISADKAKAIALELTGGGRITEFESDDDEYEIEIMSNGKEYEIEIHSYTGKVLDFEVEEDDDYYDDDDDDYYDDDDDDRDDDDRDDD